MQIEFHFGASTAIGSRSRNEDRLVGGPRCIAVADGMGGHADGDVASGIAAESLDALLHMPALESKDVMHAIQRANDRISVTATGAGRGRMGCTLSGAAIVGDSERSELLVFNIGDSRTYLLRDRHLAQLTVDDSLAGSITSSGVAARGHTVTRALGATVGEMPAIRFVAPMLGDRLLACSDGLTDVVTDDEIHDGLSVGEPSFVAHALCRLATGRAAADNVTVVVAEIVACDDHLHEASDEDTKPREPGAVR